MTRLPHPLPLALRRWLPLIVGLAVGIRISLGLMHPFHLPDSLDYDTLARALVAHQPYACGNQNPAAADVAPYLASRMPGYPLFLAAIYALGGGVKAVMVLQGLMGGMIVILTYLIGKRLHEPAALLAALLLALDPLSIGFSAALLSETPFTLCLLASLWLCLKVLPQVVPTPSSAVRTPCGTDRAHSHSKARSLLPWFALGILWAIAVYLRASALWLILPLSLAASPRRLLAASLIPLALTLALLSPWLIRNYSLFHSGPFRLTTLEGISLYEAVYPAADGSPKQDQINRALPPDIQTLNEAQRNDEWSRRAWSHITSDPARLARLALDKIARTWSPWFNAAEFRAPPIQWLMSLWNIPLFACALLGIAISFRRSRRAAALLLIPILYFTALHALFLGSVRYRVPLMPLVCLFAAAGIFHLLKCLRLSKRLSSAAV